MISIDKDKVHRIVIAQDAILKVNMVYTEIGDDTYEVFGSFSGEDGNVGLFHQNCEGDMNVSDDSFEFETKISPDEVSNICIELEQLRSKFEETDIEGNLVGLSKEGQNFLENGSNDNGYVEAYSKGASEDFIYDIQDEWSLNFFKD